MAQKFETLTNQAAGAAALQTPQQQDGLQQKLDAYAKNVELKSPRTNEGSAIGFVMQNQLNGILTFADMSKTAYKKVMVDIRKKDKYEKESFLQRHTISLGHDKTLGYHDGKRWADPQNIIDLHDGRWMNPYQPDYPWYPDQPPTNFDTNFFHIGIFDGFIRDRYIGGMENNKLTAITFQCSINSGGNTCSADYAIVLDHSIMHGTMPEIKEESLVMQCSKQGTVHAQWRARGTHARYQFTTARGETQPLKRLTQAQANMTPNAREACMSAQEFIMVHFTKENGGAIDLPKFFAGPLCDNYSLRAIAVFFGPIIAEGTAIYAKSPKDQQEQFEVQSINNMAYYMSKGTHLQNL